MYSALAGVYIAQNFPFIFVEYFVFQIEYEIWYTYYSITSSLNPPEMINTNKKE